MDDPGNLIRAAWLVLLFYWIFASLSVNRIKNREPAVSRLTRLAVIAATLLLLNTDLGSSGFLGRRFVPFTLSIVWLGAILTLVGVAFAIWARVHIGRYWSGTVALKVGHELIRTGPYAHIRHPIYTGVLLMLAGTALAIGRYGALLAFLLLLADLILEIQKGGSITRAGVRRRLRGASQPHRLFLTALFLMRLMWSAAACRRC